ncbi:type II toxin-antitoxin system PemK/MazF family toxin [Fructilactobacillus sp. Tb1]|uniref:type II toxin-antitoxin system PemK/MazF family toxin n=1 Tax=Fructilactobacillus sp. Tb1 TaxID=3422304 RepID=UPI003D274309
MMRVRITEENNLVTLFVAFNKTGKRRPVLILEKNGSFLSFFRLSTKYDNKSDEIKSVYYPLIDWKQSGLSKQSYIDVGTVLNVNISNSRLKKIGSLSDRDVAGINHLMEKLHHQ